MCFCSFLITAFIHFILPSVYFVYLLFLFFLLVFSSSSLLEATTMKLYVFFLFFFLETTFFLQHFLSVVIPGAALSKALLSSRHLFQDCKVQKPARLKGGSFHGFFDLFLHPLYASHGWTTWLSFAVSFVLHVFSSCSL